MADVILFREGDGLSEAVAHCDKMIKEGDDIAQDFWVMVKRSLLSGESKFEEWDNGRVL